MPPPGQVVDVDDPEMRLAQDLRQFDYTSPWEGPHYVLPGDEKAGDKA